MPEGIVKRRTLAAMERRIGSATYVELAGLAATAWVTPEPVPFRSRRQGRKLILRPGDQWSAAPFDCAWFLFTGAVPAAAAGKDVVLLIDVNGEACVVDDRGRPKLGLTNASSAFSRHLGHPGKCVVPFRAPAAGGETVELWVEAGANDLFGNRQQNGTLRRAQIAIRSPGLCALQYDFAVARELMRNLPRQNLRARELRETLSRACEVLHHFTEEEAAAARALIAPALARRGGGPSPTITAVGHAHMDLAWLWPVRETIRKSARTFSTALDLLERYPDYIFGASQPQQYEWVKGYHPDLYRRIQQRVAEGRWEVQGPMWVEADLNLPGGESLVRQILYGKRFWRNEFGKDTTILWAPDCFGFPGSLPQILAQAGVPCFMTQKLSWNLVTKHPHHTFWWQGIDGSRVLAHMPPEATYNSSAGPRAVLAAARNFIDKPLSDRCLMLFGIGNGGGGPGEEHIERLAREKNLDGLWPVKQEPAEAFFRHIAEADARYASWVGELYLERHQGTYTTQGGIKRSNRKLELALRELEFTAAMAEQFGGASYPQQALDRIWKELLLYQFHDILPGSSISRVYQETHARYAVLAGEIEALTREAEAALCRRIDGSSMKVPVVVMNSLSWGRTAWLEIGGKWVETTVPALGYAVVDAAVGADCVAPGVSPALLENETLRIAFNPDGSISSCFDKEHGREAIARGATGNVLAVYRDDGDAWDIPMDYRDIAPRRFLLESAETFAQGPRAGVRHTYRFGRSQLCQEVVLFSGSRRVDFITTVDWQESASMLRTSFPVDVAATEATCEIQFGSIRRPTHRNTPADAAKFEVCAHKWVDLSDRGYGVALLNDCKYGHRVHGSILDLDLLRSPAYPDPMADRGRHCFTYSLYPHAGDHVIGAVARAGYELNVPLRPLSSTVGDGPLPQSTSWFEIQAPNIIVETVKRAEDGRGLIVRLYEAAGASTRTVLRCGLAPALAASTNLIEEDERPLEIAGSAVELAFRPFEIRTLRIEPNAV